MFAFDLQGRPLFNASVADPPLGHLTDLVIARGLDGGELILLDSTSSQLVAVARNGSVSTFPTPVELPSAAMLHGMEYAGNGEVYLSVMEEYGSGAQRSFNSSIWRVDRQGRLLDRFVTGPGGGMGSRSTASAHEGMTCTPATTCTT